MLNAKDRYLSCLPCPLDDTADRVNVDRHPSHQCRNLSVEMELTTVAVALVQNPREMRLTYANTCPVRWSFQVPQPPLVSL